MRVRNILDSDILDSRKYAHSFTVAHRYTPTVRNVCADHAGGMKALGDRHGETVCVYAGAAVVCVVWLLLCCVCLVGGGGVPEVAFFFGAALELSLDRKSVV